MTTAFLVIKLIILGKVLGDCSFQYSTCDWVIHGSKGIFPWNRTNGEILQNEGILGPETDHQYETNRESSLSMSSF